MAITKVSSGNNGSGVGGLNISSMIQPLIELQVTMATLKAFTGMFNGGGMGGFGGGGDGSSSGFVGPLLGKQSATGLTNALDAALANTVGIAASTPSATTATQGAKDLANALKTYAAGVSSAATVQALTGPNAGSGAALAVALV